MKLKYTGHMGLEVLIIVSVSYSVSEVEEDARGLLPSGTHKPESTQRFI